MKDFPGMRRSWAFAWLPILVAVLVLASGGAALAAIRFDAARRTEMLQGVSIGGVPVGGLQLRVARARLLEAYESPLDRPMSVEADGRYFTATPRELGAGTDVLDRLAEARQTHGAMPLFRRLWHRLTGIPVGGDLRVRTLVDVAKVEAFVDSMAEAVDRPAVDASVEMVGGRIRITPETQGFALDREATTRQLRDALATGDVVVHASGEAVAPALRRGDVTDVLVVKVGENKLLHFEGEQLAKEYEVATGLPNYATPLGEFKVINKRRNPTWVNPAKFPGGWGWNLPARIAAGPGSPLGTRALDINSPGIRIHGTYANNSIGYNASHGCIRMRIADVEELFEKVQVGTPVIIVQTGDFRVMKRAAASQPEPSAETDATAIPGQPVPPATPTPA